MLVHRLSVRNFFKGDSSLRRNYHLYPFVIDYSFNTTASVVSGSLKYDSSLYNAIPTAYFDGSTKIDINDSFTYYNVTHLNWIKVDKYTTDFRIFSHVGGHSGVGHYYGFNLGIFKSDDPSKPGAIRFGYYSNTDYSLDTTKRYDDNNWHLLVQVRDGSVHYAYIDGELVGLRNIDTAGTQPGGDCIGYNRDYNTNILVGNLVEHSVFSRALSPQEIKSYYQWATSQKKLFFFPLETLNTGIIRRRLLVK